MLFSTVLEVPNVPLSDKLTCLGGGAGKAYSIENVLALGGLRHHGLTGSLRLRVWGCHPGVAFHDDVLGMNYFSENGGTDWTFLRTEFTGNVEPSCGATASNQTLLPDDTPPLTSCFFLEKSDNLCESPPRVSGRQLNRKLSCYMSRACSRASRVSQSSPVRGDR